MFTTAPSSSPPLTLHPRQLRLLRLLRLLRVGRAAALRPPQAGRHLLLRQAQPHQRIVDLPLQSIEVQVGGGLPAAVPTTALAAAALAGSRRLFIRRLGWRLLLCRGALRLREKGAGEQGCVQGQQGAYPCWGATNTVAFLTATPFPSQPYCCPGPFTPWSPPLAPSPDRTCVSSAASFMARPSLARGSATMTGRNRHSCQEVRNHVASSVCDCSKQPGCC